MRKKPGQSYADWLDQIKSEELVRAAKELKQGASPEQTLENFAENFFKKSMHPLYKMIETEYQKQYKKKDT